MEHKYEASEFSVSIRIPFEEKKHPEMMRHAKRRSIELKKTLEEKLIKAFKENVSDRKTKKNRK